MKLNQIADRPGSHKKRVRIGRGIGSGVGKTGGRGGKGQTARDGVRLLGMGELKAKVAFSVWGASKSAVAAVEKAGGSVAILAPQKEAGETAA